MVAIRHTDEFWNHFKEACKLLRIDCLRAAPQDFTHAATNFLAHHGGVAYHHHDGLHTATIFIHSQKFIPVIVADESQLHAITKAVLIVKQHEVAAENTGKPDPNRDPDE